MAGSTEDGKMELHRVSFVRKRNVRGPTEQVYWFEDAREAMEKFHHLKRLAPKFYSRVDWVKFNASFNKVLGSKNCEADNPLTNRPR